MECYNENIKRDIFCFPTTYQNDYRPYCTHKKDIRKRLSERSEPPKKPNPLAGIDDHESFTTWKPGVHIPFDLLLQPKPIIGTDPYKSFQKLAPIPNNKKEEAMQTRPRVYMTPAASLDDVDDLEMRELLCNYMYTTEWKAAEKEAVGSVKNHKTKISSKKREITTSDPVKLQVDLYKPIEESFQQRGKTWDDPQLRALTDPTTDFWVHKDPPVLCGACVDPFRNIIPKETKREIRSLISSEKLRFAHDYPPPTYSGYRVRLAKGVPLSKVDLPTVHPFLSTSQAMTARYAEDLKK
ncbi:hypothetical protein NQ315_016301 [Exocentrus adspersus]|uniref:Uncharacterized protein n=1 Tax=Exocentrus adspersus TaxID=1586481 RepID=A0AAV8VQ97_9CUCU|nr:hypothetical protein NQ315_016301 [Exocentrus adspersus]